MNNVHNHFTITLLDPLKLFLIFLFIRNESSLSVLLLVTSLVLLSYTITEIE